MTPNIPHSHASSAPLTPAVLHILLALTDGERHGYAIAKEVEEATDEQLKMGAGTLYGSIQRMLSADLIEETAHKPKATDPHDDRGRRYYKMTRVGHRALHAELKRLELVVALARGKGLLSSR